MSRIMLAAIVALSSFAGPLHALDVSSCPATVPPREVGMLQADLVCSDGEAGHPYSAIKLERGASLDLNGHSVTFSRGATAFVAVECAEKCTLGNGTITSTDGGVGISTKARARVVARDLTLSGFHTGIQSAVGKIALENVTIDAEAWGLTPVKKIQLENVHVTLSNPGATNECLGASQPGGRVKGRQVVLTGCGTGVLANKITLEDLTVTGTHGFGVFGGSVRLSNSSVNGSGFYDVVSASIPRLLSTTCGTSARGLSDGTFGTWGVCADD